MLVEPTAPVRAGLIGFGLGGEVFHAPVVDSNADMRLVTIVTSDASARARRAGTRASWTASNAVGGGA
jgi:hypothetical protein